MSHPNSREPGASALAQAIGGGRGILDSGLPALVFVVTRVATHRVGIAVGAAVGVGLALVALRAARREPVQQVVSGFFGLALAVAFALHTHSGKGFFLPGIALTGLSGAAFLVSVLIGRPAVGPLLAAFDGHYCGWRTDQRLYRACVISTVVWAVSFFLRAGVAFALYRLKGDHDALLLVVSSAVKYPSIVLAAFVTLVLVRRAHPKSEPGGPSGSDLAV